MISPTPVLRSVPGVTQIDTIPSSSTTAATTWMPCRARTGGGRLPDRQAAGGVTHNAAPRSTITSSTMTTVNSSFTAIVVLTPTSVTPEHPDRS